MTSVRYLDHKGERYIRKNDVLLLLREIKDNMKASAPNALTKEIVELTMMSGINSIEQV